MDDLSRRVDAVREHVHVEWTPARAARVADALSRRLARRQLVLYAGVGALAGAAAVTLVLVGLTLLAPASGQSGVYVESPEPEPSAPEVAPVPSPLPAKSAGRAGAGTWRSLANSGDFERAYRALASVGPADVRDVPEELLLASDVARLSHHPAKAVPPLQKLLSKHRDDPRASLAAFTLGRVLLDELGRPREAALAFADAQTLAPQGPLAEDALAREVEAWSRAGETGLAHERAERYVARFPEGLRLKAVERYGGLE